MLDVGYDPNILRTCTTTGDMHWEYFLGILMVLEGVESCIWKRAVPLENMKGLN